MSYPRSHIVWQSWRTSRLLFRTGMRLRGNDGGVGRDDDNEGFVGWALPTVFPVFMRLSWWAEPTLLKSCWDDAYVGQQWN